VDRVVSAKYPRSHEGVALVTGGSRGIGAAIVRSIAADGWPVAIGYRSGAEEAEAVRAQVQADGGTAITLQGDVAEPGVGDRLLADAQEQLGAPVLVLVNNAGVRRDGLSPQITDEDWDTVLTTNLTGAFRLTRRAVRTMIRARFGRVVNIASIVGMKANPGQSNYAAAKAGLIGMTATVAAEVARRGVTVNAVAPGFIQTDMTEELTDDWLNLIPARRLGTPEDVAGAVRFLASEDASYVTGTTLVVDGGLTA
jgi:3-oxoacyl-[acyl-carrier protein] reductase